MEQLKQEYETTTQALQLRMATLEQQIQSQKESSEKAKEATVSAADLAAERAAKAVLGESSDQVGAKFQGALPSEPTYDLLVMTMICLCFEKKHLEGGICCSGTMAVPYAGDISA